MLKLGIWLLSMSFESLFEPIPVITVPMDMFLLGFWVVFCFLIDDVESSIFYFCFVVFVFCGYFLVVGNVQSELETGGSFEFFVNR